MALRAWPDGPLLGRSDAHASLLATTVPAVADAPQVVARLRGGVCSRFRDNGNFSATLTGSPGATDETSPFAARARLTDNAKACSKRAREDLRASLRADGGEEAVADWQQSGDEALVDRHGLQQGADGVGVGVVDVRVGHLVVPQSVVDGDDAARAEQP